MTDARGAAAPADAPAGDLVRLDLDAPLAGYHIVIDRDRLTLGTVEDLESGRVALMLDAIAALIVHGDLPHGTDRAGLRALRPREMQALTRAIDASFRAGAG